MSDQGTETRLNRPLKQGEILVYSEENFSGEERLIPKDSPQVNLPFPAASLRIGPKTSVTIFEGEGFQGVSQEVPSDLSSLTGSKLQDRKPNSLKIWSTDGRHFTGYWAIEVTGGIYLSVQPDGTLTTSAAVSGREAFLITDTGEAAFGRKPAAITVQDASFEAPAAPPAYLTIADLGEVTYVDEPGAGFRKFSLLAENGQWILYHPDQKQFTTTEQPESRTIFCQSIKIAIDETQVGELVQGEAALYENACYWGKAWIFYSDFENFENIVDLNDQVSSIQLGPLTGVTIYRGGYHVDPSKPEEEQDITTNLPALEKEMENQISALRIWQIRSPRAMGIAINCCLSQDYRSVGGTFEEYTAYRTTIRLPATVETVQVWSTEETQIVVDDQTYDVDEDLSVTLKPDLVHYLVITTDAMVSSADGTQRGSLRAPGLKIRTNTMQPNERVVIFPDQEVHARLANLKDDELWNATYTDRQGITHDVIQDRKPQKRSDVAHVQSMVKKAMSTVKYTAGESGGWDQAISPEGLGGKSWALDFLIYRVSADSLYLRKGPGIAHDPVGVLHRDDVIEVLEYNLDASWIHVRRKADRKEGWCSSKYVDRIAEDPTFPKGGRYRIKGESVHVREGPGTSFRSLGYLQASDVVTAVGSNAKRTWIKIKRGDDLVGWSSSRYLSLVQVPERRVSFDVLAMVEPEQPPGMQVLAAEVNFHEISQAEVDALLAIARSSEADLAQGWFDDLGRAIKTGVSFVITQVQEGIEILISVAGMVKDFVVDTAEKVAAFVEGIIEKIGAAVEDVIKYLRFLFEWKDILATRDYLRDSTLRFLDVASEILVKKAEGAVTSFFAQTKKDVTAGFDRVIRDLGGDPGKEMASHISSSSIMSAMQSLGLDKLIEKGEWLLSKVMSAASGNLAFALSTADADPTSERNRLELLNLWENQVVNGLNTVSAIPDGVLEIINTLARQPDQPLLAVAALVRIFRELAEGLLEMAEDLVIGLLKLVSYLIQQIKRLISENIRIPFLSDLLAWLNLGDGSLGFSLLDAITLVLAVPITVISKIVTGTPPFEDEPVLAQSASGWTITAGVADAFNGFVSIILDAAPSNSLGPAGSKLEVFSLICSFVSTSATYGPDLAGMEADDSQAQTPENTSSGWWWALFGYESLSLLADIVAMLAGCALSEKAMKLARFKRYNEGTMVVASICGFIHAGLLVGKDVALQEQDEIGADIFSTLPEIFSFIKIWEEAYPFCLLIALVFGVIDASAGLQSLVGAVDDANELLTASRGSLEPVSPNP